MSRGEEAGGGEERNKIALQMLWVCFRYMSAHDVKFMSCCSRIKNILKGVALPHTHWRATENMAGLLPLGISIMYRENPSKLWNACRLGWVSYTLPENPRAPAELTSS